MSLYYEAADILKQDTSFKSVIFGSKTWKSDPKTLFALTTEAAKWSSILSEVVEKGSVLKIEKNLTPSLALLLTHDLLLSKKGVALPQNHGLNKAITRHKVRLSAELTKARLRQGFASLDALREHVNSEACNGQATDANGTLLARHPRWIRINNIKTSMDEELPVTFADYTLVPTLKDVMMASPGDRVLHIDEHIPDLIAIAGPDDSTSFASYKSGKLILQEKASCFPAYLVSPIPGQGDVIDACAAPGNKTTHLAAILAKSTRVSMAHASLDAISSSRIIACEKDPTRSKTLQKMTSLAGASEIVTIKSNQDFLRLNPTSKEFSNVTTLLLDPSCSGSGIIGREAATIPVQLPSMSNEESAPKGKKRKRGREQSKQEPIPDDAVIEETPEQDDQDEAKVKARLESLSAFQLRLLQHAMSFPAANQISYSTCSIHAEENENVVVRALLSDVALSRDWRVLKRDEQPSGLKRWHKRGIQDSVRDALAVVEADDANKAGFDVTEVADACIRCDRGGADGTMGFFVAGFVNIRVDTGFAKEEPHENMVIADASYDDDEEWAGFSDDETYTQ